MRTNSFFWRLGCAVTLLLSCTVASAPVALGDAPASQVITMMPSSAEATIAPGAAASGAFEVTNEGMTTYSVKTYAAPYRVKGIDYDPQFTLLPGTVDASQWIHISSTGTQGLAAHQSIDTSYTVTVPPSTAPGGYYAVLFAETDAPTGMGGIATHDRVGDILYITVSGRVKAGGTVRAQLVPHVTLSSRATLGVVVGNTGGVHFVTDTTFTVRNIFGKRILQAASAHYVLPQTQRRITASWPTPLFGLYRISRQATVAGHTRMVPDTWVLVARPWIMMLIGGVIGLCIAGLVIRSLLRRRTA